MPGVDSLSDENQQRFRLLNRAYHYAYYKYNLCVDQVDVLDNVLRKEYVRMRSYKQKNLGAFMASTRIRMRVLLGVRLAIRNNSKKYLNTARRLNGILNNW